MSAKSGSASRRAGKSATAERETTLARIFDVGLHGGKVVATCRGEVIAMGETFSEVDNEIRRRGLQNEVILTRVPETEDVVL